MPRKKKPDATGDHPRSHARVLISLLPAELDELDAVVREVYPPGRENRSEFVRQAIAEKIAQWREAHGPKKGGKGS